MVYKHILIIKTDILVQGKGPKDRLDDTKITAKAEYSINIQISKKEIVKVCVTVKVTV